MEPHVFSWIQAERDRVQARIRTAFAGVNRDGGVSWSESVVIDGDGSGRTPEMARAEDQESSWESLVDDASWPLENGMGGFNFLDPIGTKYYIAPAMMRATHGEETANVSFALYFDPPPHAGDFRAHRYSLLNHTQRHAIYLFLVYMVLLDAARGYESGQCRWIDCLANHWGKFATNTGPDGVAV